MKIPDYDYFKDSNEAQIDHDFVPDELRVFITGLEQKLLEAAVMLNFEFQLQDLNNEIARVKIPKVIELAQQDLAAKIAEYNQELSVARFQDFNLSELIEALRQVVFREPIFLQGKMKINLDNNRAQFMARDGIINSTKTVIHFKNGILIIGFSQDELELSVAVYWK